MTPGHFDRFGTSYHLALNAVDDLLVALELDSALWVASAAPVDTFNLDPELLRWLDDADGRLRAEELREWIWWTLAIFTDHDVLLGRQTTLRLSSLDPTHPEVPDLLDTARDALERLGSDEREAITLEQVRQVRLEEEARGMSEAGLIVPERVDDPEARGLLEAVVETVGGVPHPDAPAAVGPSQLDAFLEQLRAHQEWYGAHVADEDARARHLPFAEETARVAALAGSLGPRARVFHALCDAVELEPTLAARAWIGEAHAERLDPFDPETVHALLESAPLARPAPGASIDLEGALNPVFRADLLELAALVGWSGEVGRNQWQELEEALGPWRAWREAEPDSPVGGLEPARRARLLEDTGAHERARALLEESHVSSLEIERLRLVERAALMQAELMDLARSFISFPDLYDPARRATFEMGTLVIDGRHMTLALRVLDRARHARYAQASNTFVLFVEVLGASGEVLYEVAVPVTSGGRGNLLEAKWGVFYDLEGAEHHARVVQIVDNPISLREAFLAPFKSLVAAINDRVEKLSESQQTELVAKGTAPVDEAGAALSGATAKAATPAPPAPTPAAPSPAPPPAAGPDRYATGAVALAALGSSFAFITSTLQSIGWARIALSLVGLLVLVLLPVLVVAWMKLRRRNLSALLEGSGWAINAQMRLSRRQAATFTFTPEPPAGSTGLGWRRAQWVLSRAAIVLVVAFALAAAWLSFQYG